MSQATTYSVSPQLLAREDFRAACAARDFGTVFRLMKKYDGASQDRICSPVEGLAQSRVSRIMRGDDRVATLDLIERIIDGLRIPGSYVGLLPRDWEPTTAAPGAIPPAAPATVTALHPRTATNGNTALDPAGRLSPVHGPEMLAGTEARPYVPAQVGRPVGLRPHIERAFAEDTVTIDFAGFSGNLFQLNDTWPFGPPRSRKMGVGRPVRGDVVGDECFEPAVERDAGATFRDPELLLRARD